MLFFVLFFTLLGAYICIIRAVLVQQRKIIVPMIRNNFTLFLLGIFMLLSADIWANSDTHHPNLSPPLSSLDDDECFLLKAPNQDLPLGENCIPIRISGMSRSYQLEFNISWSGLAHFDSLDYSNISINGGMLLLDTSELMDNKLGFALVEVWQGVPDNFILFEICIDRAAFTDDVSTISFSSDSPRTPQRNLNGENKGIQYADGTIHLSGGSSNLEIDNACIDYTLCDPLTAGFELDISGGTTPYTYNWVGPDNFTANTEDIFPTTLMEGLYSVTVTDLVGDSRTAVLEVIKPQLLPQTYYLDPVNCFGENTGSISFSPLDTSLQLNFQWSNGADSSFVGNLSAGTYTVTLTDNLSCRWEKEFVVFEASEIVSNNPVFYCAGAGQSNGDIELNLSGGIGAYSTEWSNGYNAADDHLQNAAAGIYEVTITDFAGCTKVISNLEIEEAGNLELLDSVSICLGDSIELFSAVPAGATLTYLWPTDGVNCDPCIPPFKIHPTASATYEVRMEDGNCSYQEISEIFVDDICTWPGDTDTNKLVNHFDLLPIGLAHGSTGPTRPNASLAWRAEPGPEWGQATPISLVDYKHIDVDGNGLIEDADTSGIAQNWGKMHDYRKENSDEKDLDGIPLYLEVDTLFEGQTYALRVLLGEATNPAIDVYGLAFSLYFDPDIIVDGSTFLSTETSWLGSSAELLLMQRVDDAVGQLDVAFTRRDGISIDGSGQIASFNITIEDDIFLKSNGDDSQLLNQQKVPFEIRNVRAIDEKEEEINTDPEDTQGTLSKVSTGTKESWLAQQIEVYPNPAQLEVLIRTQSLVLEKVALYNAAGVKMEEWLPEQKRSQISVEAFEEGVYWLEINTGEGVHMERLVIIK